MCLYHTVSQFHLYSCSKQEPYVMEDPVRHSFLFSFALQYCAIYLHLVGSLQSWIEHSSSWQLIVCFGRCSESFAGHWYLGLLPEHFCQILNRFERIFQAFQSFQIFPSIWTCSFCIFLLHDLNKSTPVSSTRLHTFNPKSTKSFKLSLSDFIFGVRAPLEDVSKFHWWFSCAQTWLVIGCMSEDMSRTCLPVGRFEDIWSILTLRNNEKHILVDEDKAAMMSWALFWEHWPARIVCPRSNSHTLRENQETKQGRRFRNGWSKMMWIYLRSFLCNFENDFHIFSQMFQAFEALRLCSFSAPRAGRKAAQVHARPDGRCWGNEVDHSEITMATDL